MHSWMVALARYIDAHSHSQDINEVPFTLEVLTSELTHFDNIKSDYSKTRKEWENAKLEVAGVFS